MMIHIKYLIQGQTQKGSKVRWLLQTGFHNQELLLFVEFLCVPGVRGNGSWKDPNLQGSFTHRWMIIRAILICPEGGCLGGAKCQGGGECEQQQPGQACPFHRCSDVLLSFKGQIIPRGHQPHYITYSSASSCS